ncbi:uncharacterized protein LOC133923258 [Phragmites australis]|uniref:uncharacterized protein LOC133923258 n=1 Tax=Phragmites australis TaxID=29695 RepID=UPI002D766CC1|nr:uncharacterized protein LOC133923258 [Phragmites australis]
MATPSRSLPRSASGSADAQSPFSSNPAHHPVSTPITPAAASSSFGCMAATPTDSPPATPKEKPKPAPSAAAYYASLWSPRRLMQRAARAFHSSRSRRMRKDAGEEPTSVTSKVSDAPSVVSSLEAELAVDANGGGAANVQEEHHHLEVVPEKIIHEANHQAPPVMKEVEEECVKTAPAEEKDTAAIEEEEPKKGAAPAPKAVAVADGVADKFMIVVKEAIKKHVEHAADQDEKEEAMRTFQGSRVKTAMEARPESEQPRRREVARSNDVIEEARSKLLEKRQFGRVRALVGAFETVMDAKHDAAAPPPQVGLNQSTTKTHAPCFVCRTLP